MPDMKDPLISRIRAAADAYQPELDPTAFRMPSKKVFPLKLGLSLMAVASATAIALFTAQPPISISNVGAVSSYGDHDSGWFEDYTPAWNLGWLGSKGTAYELKVRSDLAIRETELKSELSKLDKTKLGGLSLVGFGGQWHFSASELFNPESAKGTLPSQEYVRQAATKIFIASGFDGDLNSMTFESDSQTITARVDQPVGGHHVGMNYSVTFMRGGILYLAEGWLVKVIEHHNFPVISARDVVSTIKWRTVDKDFSFESRKWDGDANPASKIVGWEEPLSSQQLSTMVKQHHLTITASSKSMTLTQTMLGQAWVVPSFYLASGKTVIGNYPAISEETLRNR